MKLFKKNSSKKDPEDHNNHQIDLPSSESILENITNGFLILDRNWRLKYTNKSMEYFVRKTRDELIGHNIWDVLPEAVGTKFYHNYHKAMAEQIPVIFEDYYEPTKEWLEISVFPSEEGLIGYAFNITERKNHEQIIEHMAYHDYLTDLPNRRFFEKKLEQFIEQANEKQYVIALIYIDMDRFQNINDTLGHGLGDQLIKEFSVRLVQYIDDKGFVARLGGDEFAVVLDKQFDNKEEVEKLADSIIKHIEASPFLNDDYEHYITASLGISFYPQHGMDAQTLVKNADIALYRSKEKGGNRCTFYNPIMDIDSFKRFTLEKDLRLAIHDNKLELYFQPRIDLKSGKIVSAESLVRWNHPEWGMLSPAEFIPLAEDTGLILPLTHWVELTVCSLITSWQAEGISYVPISINVSARQFLSKNFIQSLKQILQETQVDGHWLEIEITETSILENQKLVESTISELKTLGIKVSLDDFGTGYSSLAYLTQYNADVLKIDKYFIRDVTTNPSNAAVVKSIIHLAQGLGLKVVAEGVETMDQLTFLKQYECDEIQGYLFSKPVPVTEFKKLLAKEVLIPSEINQRIETDTRQNYFQDHLIFPISSQMTIIKIKDKVLSLGKTEVLIEEIGAQGLHFLTHLALAVSKDIIFEFEIEVFTEVIRVYGYIVWKEEVENNRNRYGLEFTKDDNDHLHHLVQLLM
ncbi:EAL domain-containing protein [Paenibacillus planticolens]|uniref:EAL domain-containing protein n=1 Tax=Paenibacillus planticolens TaxID=2654976 RepID=A0ABX1ZUX4_9BACL|nr:EAL domain-containing protein [Paenibacillus planticolens]NOV03850.1 EAL domain-containing protein [Paenibacillus planticolens]